MTKYRYFIATADEQEWNELAAGHRPLQGKEWFEGATDLRVRPGRVGVLWRDRTGDETVQPLVLACDGEDQRRLFGRFSQLRSDLSPLTTWCHLLTPSQMDSVRSTSSYPELNDWEASWVGLIVAEALLLAERSISKLRLPACLATQTFAVARAVGLWGSSSVSEAIDRFDASHRLIRPREQPLTRLRSAFEPIWACVIAAASSDATPYRYSELAPICTALRNLKCARSSGSSREVSALVEALVGHIPEIEFLHRLDDLGPEDRLHGFDVVVDAMVREAESNVFRKTALAMIAGYLSTIAAGGAPSLSLAEGHATEMPSIAAWAYLLGGIGEKVVWTSAFDGLGRLVARELMRPWRLDEPPTCDFAIEEALALADPKLADPLVHLRIKQARVLSVALLPGVCVSVPLAESSAPDIRKNADSGRAAPRSRAIKNDDHDEAQAALLADTLWPYIQPRVEASILAISPPKSESGASRGKTRKKEQRPVADQKKLWSRD